MKRSDKAPPKVEFLESDVVPGEGPPEAVIMIIGQNPGEEEVRQGRPFVGRSGKLLDRMLKQNGIDRSKLYITNVVKHRTPENRKPTAAEVRYWMPGLVEEIKRVKPKIILLMGETAWQTPRFEGIEYIETYHPAAVLRFDRFKEKFEVDFRRLKERSDRSSLSA